MTTLPGAADEPPGSVGLPLAQTEVRVVGPDGGSAGAGRTGEIQVRGPTVSAGIADPEGWLWTGDLGRLDEAGRLWVLGRRADRIVTGGENVDPAEVEGILEGSPDVGEACVVGVEDGAWGERVVASVVAAPGRQLDPEALEAHCREHLAGFKVPTRFAVVHALPRTASGKLRRAEVRTWWWGKVDCDS